MDTKIALERIEYFKTLKKDWDSYGGLPIHPVAIDRATKLIEGLSVCPINDGNIRITLGDEEVALIIDDQGGVSVPLV